MKTKKIDRYSNEIEYANFEYELGRKHLMPFFEKNNIKLSNKNIIDVGCGYGGFIIALSRLNNKCTGTNILREELEACRKFNRIKNTRVNFILDDICNSNVKSSFDIVLLNDVIEHVENPHKALKNIKKLLKKDGVIYMSFTPIYSMYGGHQQVLKNFLRFLPYIHLLPNPIYLNLIKKDKVFKELKSIKKNRVSIKFFEKIIKENKLEIIKRELYISRPSFKLQYKVPVIKNNFLKNSGITEFITTGCEYLLKKNDD